MRSALSNQRMILIILANILMQLFYFIGAVILVGFLIALINRLFYRLFNGSRVVCYGTGFLGTPVHELSHALMCLVFLHRIEEIKLFQIGDEDGVLGYVNHSYNRRNIYQVIGNYFIGVAPIIGGSLVLLLAMRFMAPTAFWDTFAYLDDYALTLQLGFSGAMFTEGFSTIWGVISSIFTAMLVDGILWWVFLVIALCLSLHMNLSSADIKGSVAGCAILAGLLIVLNFIFGFTPIYNNYISVMNFGGGYLFAILLLSLIFSLIMLAIGLIIKGIMMLFGLIFHRR